MEKCSDVLGSATVPDVVVNAVIPAMVRDQAINRGEIDAGLPFRGGHRRRWIGCGFGMDVHGEAPCFETARGAWRRLALLAMVTKPAAAFQRVGGQNSRPTRR